MGARKVLSVAAQNEQLKKALGALAQDLGVLANGIGALIVRMDDVERRLKALDGQEPVAVNIPEGETND